MSVPNNKNPLQKLLYRSGANFIGEGAVFQPPVEVRRAGARDLAGNIAAGAALVLCVGAVAIPIVNSLEDGKPHNLNNKPSNAVFGTDPTPVQTPSPHPRPTDTNLR